MCILDTRRVKMDKYIVKKIPNPYHYVVMRGDVIQSGWHDYQSALDAANCLNKGAKYIIETGKAKKVTRQSKRLTTKSAHPPLK